MTEQLATADTLILGRVTYDSFAGAWPEREAAGGEDAPMGKALGDARKIVVSPPVPLELVSAETFETGVLHLIYKPAG
ncbi:hypothetical protein [Spirillospora sp. CA-294931]|uniref:hypothetical protein n=1 Tax=Spirillospora sp. CA-294931 TaxID=3240042 RepID=UPI003D917492